VPGGRENGFAILAKERFMRRLLLLVGAIAVVALWTAPTAAAHGSSSRSTFNCDGVFTGETLRNVVVPRDGSCTLIDSTVDGSVKVRTNGFFQASNTDIDGSVRGYDALTIFLDQGSTVGGSVRAYDTFQVFLFDIAVDDHVVVHGSDDRVHICGNTIDDGDIRVSDSGRDILIGDPKAVDCAGNTLNDGEIHAEDNFTDVEFVIRGNTIDDDLHVFDNDGPSDKFVEDNVGGDELSCYRNDEPFSASGNTGWDDKRGQCSQITVCDEPLTGVTLDDVIVDRDGVCTLTGSTVTGDVRVGRNGFLQATNTDIAGSVKAYKALTLFIDGGSSVGGSVRADRTFQVFVFDSSVTRDLEVRRSDDRVHICGNTILEGDIEVDHSGRDILIGDPKAVDCAGNTVAKGDLEAEDNFTDVEFVIRGNTISVGDLEVFDNDGPVTKFVEDNVGGDRLVCAGNEEPVSALGNTGWARIQGQCVVSAP
jgi:hypothetical protein